MPAITAPGIGSGLDVESIVQTLVAAEAAPVTARLDREEADAQAELSAYGLLQSSLASFAAALESLSDIDSFQARTATSADAELFTASATSAATASTYSIEVVQLAVSQKLSSAAFADAETAVGTGTLTITVGEESLDLVIGDGNNSLAAIRDAINDADGNPGVSATIVSGDDGAHLVLTSTETGVANEITVTASGGDGGLDSLVYDPDSGITNLTEVQAAVDAVVRIDGISHTSSSNSITDAIDGVTIDLASAEPGTVTDLTVANDTGAATRAVESFVNSYNSLIATIDSLTVYDPETEIAGVLIGDSMILGLETSLRNLLSESVGGTTDGIDMLLDLGVTTTLDGTLEIDSEALQAALDSDFDAVGELFAAEDGYAVQLDALLAGYLDDDGLLDARTDGLDHQLEGIEEEREALELRLVSVEQRYRDQFTALDTLIAELTLVSEFLEAQLATIPVPGAS